MQEGQVNVPDSPACFKSIYAEVSDCMDISNSDHQTFARGLYFLTQDKAEKIPPEIQEMLKEAVQNIQAERTEFASRLKSQWLPQLPQFMKDPPKPKVQALPIMLAQHPQTSRPISPKETQLSPKEPSDSSPRLFSLQTAPTSLDEHVGSRAMPVESHSPQRRSSLPVKKGTGLLSRFRFGGQDKKQESNNANQSKSY